MNLPNKLTISRFILTIAFLVVMFSKNLFSETVSRFHETVALGLFIAGGITDFFDGHIARRDKLITNFGILMDPLADKIMVCSAFIAFVGLQWIPAWMVVIIVARELATAAAVRIGGLAGVQAGNVLISYDDGFAGNVRSCPPGNLRLGSRVIVEIGNVPFRTLLPALNLSSMNLSSTSRRTILIGLELK